VENGMSENVQPQSKKKDKRLIGSARPAGWDVEAQERFNEQQRIYRPSARP
jgi:hypothetical protein